MVVDQQYLEPLGLYPGLGAGAGLVPGQAAETYQVAGEEILAHLGYTLNCSRVGGLGDPGSVYGPGNACWYDLTIPLGVIVAAVTASVLLLAFCVKDTH